MSSVKQAVGNVVRLNSGGPKMTVVGTRTVRRGNEYGTEAYCQWWHDAEGQYNQAWFAEEGLEVVV